MQSFDSDPPLIFRPAKARLLASRLAFRGSPVGVLTAMVGALLAFTLCGLIGLVSFLNLAAQKADSRFSGSPAVGGCIQISYRFDVLGNTGYERYVVARSSDQRCEQISPPPGLAGFPDPGEVFVSPEINRLRTTTDGMRRRFPAVAGVIGEAGLISADEKLVYVGAPFDEPTTNTTKFAIERFGGQSNWFDGFLRMRPDLLVMLALFFVIPMGAYLIYSSTLVTSQLRRRQFSILAVMGVERASLRRALVIETSITAGVGAVVGTSVAMVLVPRLSPIFFGLTPFSGDLSVPLVRAASVPIALTAVAFVASWLASGSGRRTRSTEQRSRSQSGGPARAARWWPAIALALGCGAMGASATSGSLHANGLVSYGGRGLTAIGLIGVAPTVAHAVSRTYANSSTALLFIVGERLRNPFGPTIRAIGSVAAGLFIVGVATTSVSLASAEGDAQELADALSTDGRLLIEASRPNELVVNALAGFDSLRVISPDIDSSQIDPPIAYGTCAAMRSAVGSVEKCPTGDIYAYVSYGGTGLSAQDAQLVPPTAIPEAQVGPRAEALSGLVVRTNVVWPENQEPDQILVTLPADQAQSLYDTLIGLDPTGNIGIFGAGSVAGATQYNSLLDLFRWGGYLVMALALASVTISLVALSSNRQAQSDYLSILGVTRARSALTLVAEVMLPAWWLSLMATLAAWGWGLAGAMGRGVPPVSVTDHAELLAYVVVAAMLVTGLVAIWSSGRTKRSGIPDRDGLVDIYDAYQPMSLGTSANDPRTSSSPPVDKLDRPSLRPPLDRSDF